MNGRPAKPSYDPLAPCLRSSASPDRHAQEREKTRLVELEKRINEKEKAVKDLEAQMPSPGFYDERDRAAQAADEHKKVMWEVGDLMNQWEALQTEVEARR